MQIGFTAQEIIDLVERENKDRRFGIDWEDLKKKVEENNPPIIFN